MLACDAHAHFYKLYDLSAALACLERNLNRLAPPGAPPPLLMACLVERQGWEVFSGASLPLRHGCYEVVAGPEPLCLSVRRDGRPVICLVLGRQCAAQERVEVLGLACADSPPDGLPAVELVRRIRASGGFPVLPWAPGKWFLGRGRLVRGMVADAAPGTMGLGDTTLRPLGWPMPAILRMGVARGLPLLPGSDALPLPGEERRLGAYGFVYDGAVDPARPVSELRRLLREHAAALRPAGRRGGPAATAGRLLRLRCHA